jgi:hypothetical protein
VVKWKGEFEREETQIFTGDFLVVIKVLKPGFIKKKVRRNLVSFSL